MVESTSDTRLAENEVIFREYNENVQKRFDELTKLAHDDNQRDIITETDMPLHFYCECSDENCRERIQMKPNIYNDIHIHRDLFTIVCGHEVDRIEKVIATEPDYCIVEKKEVPPAKETDGLNNTPLHNA